MYYNNYLSRNTLFGTDFWPLTYTQAYTYCVTHFLVFTFDL